MPAVEIYRERFRPSPQLEQPYVILGVNIVAADSDDDARFLGSSGRDALTSLRAGPPIQLPPPSREWEKEVVPFDPARLAGEASISIVRFVGRLRAALALVSGRWS